MSLLAIIAAVELTGAVITYLALNSDYDGWSRVGAAVLWLPLILFGVMVS